ncbi:MAG: sugar kinase [Clostridia bacterium]|nr:sugar kinase [Clostridia bacterium]MBQ4291057.1 sugar kinase [Clostridia bacterium]
MEIKPYKFAIACPTSMGVRITPVDRSTVQSGNLLYLQSTSAESNVLNIASSLGKECVVLTRFVEGSPIAAFIKNQLRQRNIRYLGPDVPQGGPWGARHQFNIADSGLGLRAPRVWNDRAGEVGANLSASDYDLEQLFLKEGVGILHLSGLIVSMSEHTSKCCLEIARAAKSAGTLISFDLNYRATFWKGREQELKEVFREIASIADVLLGNEEDFQLCLGIPGPETGGKDLASKIGRFQAMIDRVRQEYPGASAYATTLRQVVSAEKHLWGALLWTGGKWYVEEPREIPVLDRIGGGDGFCGGLLYGILSGWTPDKWLKFGWASGALAVSSLNDWAEPADEKQIWDIYEGNARVQR